MAKFAIGEVVQIINPLRPDFGDLGQVTNDYRSGLESQAYAIRFAGRDRDYWYLESDLRTIDVDALLAAKGKLYPVKAGQE